MASLRVALRSHLLSIPAVAELVGNRIYSGTLPQSFSVKSGGALFLTVISNVHGHLINGLDGIARSRIELAAYGSTPLASSAIADAVIDSGIVGFTGDMNGVQIESVTLESGPEDDEETPGDGTQEHRYLTVFDLVFAYQRGT